MLTTDASQDEALDTTIRSSLMRKPQKMMLVPLVCALFAAPSAMPASASDVPAPANVAQSATAAPSSKTATMEPAALNNSCKNTHLYPILKFIGICD